MSRVELLFGDRPSRQCVPIRRHPLPDPTRPLRMQAAGRSPARSHLLRMRGVAWKRALTSPGVLGRALVITLFVLAVLTAAQLEAGPIALLSASAAVIAIVCGAWTHVSLSASSAGPWN